MLLDSEDIDLRSNATVCWGSVDSSVSRTLLVSVDISGSRSSLEVIESVSCLLVSWVAEYLFWVEATMLCEDKLTSCLSVVWLDGDTIEKTSLVAEWFEGHWFCGSLSVWHRLVDPELSWRGLETSSLMSALGTGEDGSAGVSLSGLLTCVGVITAGRTAFVLASAGSSVKDVKK